jgi:uncharacterized protein (TIGR01777 family)
LIGSALVARFSDDAHTVTRVVRGSSVRNPRHRTVVWNPTSGVIDSEGLEGHDVVIHLAGEDIAAGRWTQARKYTVRESRIHGTRLLCETLAGLSQRPRVLVTASGVGYYGNHDPDHRVDETSPRGDGFLADLVRDWEQAAASALAAGIRVVHTRFGIVLSPNGGALAKMLPVFKVGLGGKIGSGKQVMSWIALDDLPSAMLHVIAHESLSGPVNVVSPRPVTNAEFSRVLGRVLGRPAILPVPGFAVRLLFGEMADALLLGGAHVIPHRLRETAFRFAYPDLEQALVHLLHAPTIAPVAAHG